MTEATFLILAAACYLVGAAAYGAYLFLRRPPLATVGRFAAWAAVLTHTAAIGLHCATTHRAPFATPAEALSASAWAIALSYVVLEALKKPRPTALGAVALPAAFLCLFAGAFLGAARPAAVHTVPLLSSRLTSLHILALLLAFGLLVLAFGCAALYLTQHRLLKQKKLVGGLFGRLPSLVTLDEMAFSLVAYAFPLLTVGLAAGVVEALTGSLGTRWAADPMVLTSVVTWLVYGAYLALHLLARWRGPRANYLLLGGLLAAFLTYFIPSTAHRFG